MMTQQLPAPGELISALADGELGGAEFARAVQSLQGSEQARASWHAYHLVGDVLRSGELAALGAYDAAFVARLRPGLQDQAQLGQAEMSMDAGASQIRPESAVTINDKDAANDADFRWKLVAGLASVALVAVLGWQLLAAVPLPSGAPQLARVEVQPTQEQAPVMMRDPRLDSLLAAHQQSGAISAWQMPAGFLRNATYDGSAR